MCYNTQPRLLSYILYSEQVQSHFSWSTITHDTFAKLWSTITHDHFFKILNDQITIMICDHFADHAPLISNCTESCFPVEGAIYSESSWPRNVTNSEVKSCFWNKYMDLSSGKWIQRERDQIKDPIFCSYYIINKNRILSNFDYFFFCTTKYLISI